MDGAFSRMSLGWSLLAALALIAVAVLASPLIAAVVAVTIVVFAIGMWPGRPRHR
jgi:hypothetical protein